MLWSRLTMQFALSLFAGCALFAGATQASSTANLIWSDVAEEDIVRTPQPRKFAPLRYRTLELRRAPLEALLAQAPDESVVPVARSAIRMSLPLPDGSFGDFKIVKAPIMEAPLAARFPQIRTYLAHGLDDRTATARLDVTPQGFHGQIISWQGSVYIDPFQPGDVDHYIVYQQRDAMDSEARPVCLVSGEPLAPPGHNFQRHAQSANVKSGATLHTYRTAIAATGEFTGFHGGTVEGGLAAIVTTVNRVNGILERELSVRLMLVANNHLLVFTDPATDPYDNSFESFSDLPANAITLSNVIGNANFDIGHLFRLGGGGIVGGTVCSTDKAWGWSGRNSPVGDTFDVNMVAHEIGHQLGASHTFNSSAGLCSANRPESTAYETGSGVTIMAYTTGICDADTVQINASDYYHRNSLNRMLSLISHTANIANCGSLTPTNNTPPTVTAPVVYTIPARTPFSLTASGTDADGDALTYLWEQFDLGPPNPEGMLVDLGAGPLFRNYNPSTNPTRHFPALASILSGANGSTWELLPTTNRTLNFRVTVRDNQAGGGGTGVASTSLNIVNTGGPFAVTAPDTAVTWVDAIPQTVTWNVAGTTAHGINTPTVQISLSLDGGESFPLVLASNEPNDGVATVNLAGVSPSTHARIKVEAEGNIWFDISNIDFTITDVSGVFVQSDGDAQVSEDGMVDSYTLALSKAPASEVTVTVTPDAELLTSPATLTFTVANWSVAQNISVSAVDDNRIEGPHTGTITHFANGGGFNDSDLGAIEVLITDNDSPMFVDGFESP